MSYDYRPQFELTALKNSTCLHSGLGHIHPVGDRGQEVILVRGPDLDHAVPLAKKVGSPFAII